MLYPLSSTLTYPYSLYSPYSPYKSYFRANTIAMDASSIIAIGGTQCVSREVLEDIFMSQWKVLGTFFVPQNRQKKGDQG